MGDTPGCNGRPTHDILSQGFISDCKSELKNIAKYLIGLTKPSTLQLLSRVCHYLQLYNTFDRAILSYCLLQKHVD